MVNLRFWFVTWMISYLEEIVRVKTFLDKIFAVKDLGDLKYILEIEVAKNE